MNVEHIAVYLLYKEITDDSKQPTLNINFFLPKNILNTYIHIDIVSFTYTRI